MIGVTAPSRRDPDQRRRALPRRPVHDALPEGRRAHARALRRARGALGQPPGRRDPDRQPAEHLPLRARRGSRRLPFSPRSFPSPPARRCSSAAAVFFSVPAASSRRPWPGISTWTRCSRPASSCCWPPRSRPSSASSRIGVPLLLSIPGLLLLGRRVFEADFSLVLVLRSSSSGSRGSSAGGSTISWIRKRSSATAHRAALLGRAAVAGRLQRAGGPAARAGGRDASRVPGLLYGVTAGACGSPIGSVANLIGAQIYVREGGRPALLLAPLLRRLRSDSRPSGSLRRRAPRTRKIIRRAGHVLVPDARPAGQAFWRAARHPRHLPLGREERDRGAARAVGQRQDDGAAPRRGIRDARLRAACASRTRT